MNRFELYELCVTEPVRVCRFLDAAHGHEPRTLREDFSGSGALSRCWAAISEERRAIAVDADAEPLRHLSRKAKACGVVDRVVMRRSDVIACGSKADIIAATNFPICYWHTRTDLVRYLRACRRRLNRRGVFVCDLYGGRDAFVLSKTTRRIRGPVKSLIEYTFEQREANPVSSRVLDTLSFRHVKDGKRGSSGVLHQDAFVYDWRLWSIPELADAMR